MSSSIESVILNNLVHNEKFARRSLPFLKEEYFTNTSESVVFSLVAGFIETYNSLPTKTALSISLKELDIPEQMMAGAGGIIEALAPSDENDEWLMQEAEKFCKSKALYIALHQSIQIAEGNDKVLLPDSIPQILQEALAVGFDPSVGHDYFGSAEERYDFYHNKEDRIPFDLDMLNRITGGGIPKKTLNIVMAPPGKGKSLFMCHVAASMLSQGFNVLYISMEMSEERIAERIDANLLNIHLDSIKELSKDKFLSKISNIQRKTQGRFFLKEYPTSAAHVGHFRALLGDLKLKQNFVPDIIFVDYLNICASSRIRNRGNVNSYEYIKAIAEELRGLGIEKKVPIFSATQVTRNGFDNADIDMTHTSESFGLPATADLMLALITTEEMVQLGQILVKQLKNRYRDVDKNTRFILGVDKPLMKLYDIEQSGNIMERGDLADAEDKSEVGPMIKKMERERDLESKLDFQ